MCINNNTRSTLFYFLNGITQKLPNDFHKIQRKWGTWATQEVKEPSSFGGNADHVTLGLGLGLRLTFQDCVTVR